MQHIYKEAQEMKNDIMAFRRALHEYPELGFDLPITTKYVIDELTKMGYQPKTLIKSGVVCELPGTSKDTLLLRADMDGFEGIEEAELSFASKNNNHHICGHDCHTAILLGTAKLLKRYEHSLQKTVRFMFQPAEEITKGAQAMIDKGILKHVTQAMSFHMISALGCGNGKIIMPPSGPNMLGLKVLEIKRNYTMDLQSICDQLNNKDSANYFQDYLHVHFYSKADETIICIIRSYQESLINAATQAIMTCFHHPGDVVILDDIPPLCASSAVLSECQHLFKTHLKPDDVITFDTLFHPNFSASDDMALILKEVPGVHLFLTSEVKNKESVYPIHHPSVIIDDENLYKAVAAMSLLALNPIHQNKEEI